MGILNATLKGELIQSSEKKENIERKIQRQQKEIACLKEKLINTSSEFSSVLASFNRAQGFNEEQFKILSTEKNQLDNKLIQFKSEGTKLEEQNQELDVALATEKALLKRHTEQYETVLSQLEKSRKEFESVKLNFPSPT